ARKYKNELVNKNLILEMPSNGQMATRYAINEDLDLHKDSFTYVNQNGEKRFTFIKIPRFLQHSHFNGCKNYKYQVLCIKTDCFTSRKQKKQNEKLNIFLHLNYQKIVLYYFITNQIKLVIKLSLQIKLRETIQKILVHLQKIIGLPLKNSRLENLNLKNYILES